MPHSSPSADNKLPDAVSSPEQSLEFAKVFQDDVPLIDLRAPVEYDRGSFPTSVNLPILNDEEREIIGRLYKQSGREAAILKGEELVAGETRLERIAAWTRFIERNPACRLYCFRGGLRSKTAQAWLAQHGVTLAPVAGGYKALRRFLLETLERLATEKEFVIVAGKTGCAKTHLINELTASLDLEGIANHRGSAFGSRVGGQPNQINFENALAVAALKLPIARYSRLFLEDESRAIGSLSLPINLYRSMSSSPMAVIEETLENRTETILSDYIISNLRDFQSIARDDEQATVLFSEFLLGSLSRIRRRLGDDNRGLISATMKQALSEPNQEASLDLHRQWIALLLSRYYDPMYEYQLDKKMDRIVFRGNKEEFRRWSLRISVQQA